MVVTAVISGAALVVVLVVIIVKGFSELLGLEKYQKNHDTLTVWLLLLTDVAISY